MNKGFINLQTRLLRFVIVLTAVGIITGCYAKVRYENPSLGFAIQHPSSWTTLLRQGLPVAVWLLPRGLLHELWAASGRSNRTEQWAIFGKFRS